MKLRNNCLQSHTLIVSQCSFFLEKKVVFYDEATANGQCCMCMSLNVSFACTCLSVALLCLLNRGACVRVCVFFAGETRGMCTRKHNSQKSPTAR